MTKYCNDFRMTKELSFLGTNNEVTPDVDLLLNKLDKILTVLGPDTA